MPVVQRFTVLQMCRTHGETLHVIDAAGKRYRCRACRVDYVQKRRLRVKQMAVEYLGGACKRCGYSRYIGALEFHHRDPEQKDFEITAALGWAAIVAELEKCDLLCANCHREVHDALRSD